jgi:hypothetical protein
MMINRRHLIGASAATVLPAGSSLPLMAKAETATTVEYGNKYENNGEINVRMFGAKGDGIADDTVAVQAALDYGGAIYFPAGIYIISSPLQIRTPHNYRNGKPVKGENAHVLFGPPGNRPAAIIQTSPSFSGRSMLRQWDGSWYAPGETDQNIPPANLTKYSNLIDPYINILNLYFVVDGAMNGSVTAIDLISANETAQIRGCAFGGRSAAPKGYPIRLRVVTGSRGLDGWKIADIVCYWDNLEGELFIDTSIQLGVDVDIDNWVTSPFVHRNSPFFILASDVTMRNIHCEAWATGKPVFAIRGTDLSISQSFLEFKEGTGDMFDFSNPHGAGYAHTGISADSLTLWGIGSLTNVRSINILNDHSQSRTIMAKLLAPSNQAIVYIYNMNRALFRACDQNGGTYGDGYLVGS